MKKFKFGMGLLVVGFMLVGALILLEKEEERAVNSCVKSGHEKTYCEYHAR